MIRLIIICVLGIVSSLPGFAQSSIQAKPNASIDMIIKNSPEQTFILRSRDTDMKYHVVDSVMLGKNGGTDSLHFDLLVIGSESQLNLIFRKKKIGLLVPLLVPGDHFKMIVDVNEPNNIVFSGSALTYEYADFLKKRKIIVGENLLKYRMALKAGAADSVMLRHKVDSIVKLEGIFIKHAIFNTHCAYLAIMALYGSQNGTVNYTKDEYTQLRNRFKDNKPVLMQIDINERIQGHPVQFKPKPAIGTYLANFSLPDRAGKPISLNEFKGKYVLVDFWASWCGPCRRETPYLKDAFKKFSKKNLVILSVSIDENMENWEKAIDMDKTEEFIQVIDTHGWKSPVTSQYNIHSIPSNFLLDPTGKIIDKDLRDEKLSLRLADVLKN